MHKKVTLSTLVLTIILCSALGVALVTYEQYSSDAPSCSTQTSMALVQGGWFDMGAGAIYPEEMPMIKVQVKSFYMSRHEVTNAEFSLFVEETGYITFSEKLPNPDYYPNISTEQLNAGSAVFVKPSSNSEASNAMNWWHFIEGASWRHPQGPGSNIQGKEYYPVVHIAYEDALAYANWIGQRLPTEAEFEFASRGGLNAEKFATGSKLTQNNLHIANTWQGAFPFENSVEDGYAGLAPVGCYPPNPYGVHDLIGNVWEWTNTTYYPRHFVDGKIPPGLPEKGYDKRQPGVPVGVIKGDSFLCAEDVCMRYRPAARQAQDTGLGTSHIGFRTVKDI
jgi:sulfatase modifying factor 1